MEHLLYDNILFPARCSEEVLNEIKELEYHPEDLCLVAFPGSGLAWLEWIVSQLLSLHYSTERNREAVEASLETVPFLEEITTKQELQDTFIDVKPPRFVKSNLAAKFYENQLDELKFRAIVLMRNPKDTLVQCFYSHIQNEYSGEEKLTWNDFFELVTSNRLLYGDWFDHVTDWWQHRGNPNLLFLKYEEFYTDLRSVILKIARYFSMKLNDHDLEMIHSKSQDFEDQKATSPREPSDKQTPNVTSSEEEENDITNRAEDDYEPIYEEFLREDVPSIGGWQKIFLVKQDEYIDDLYDMRLSETGLDFIFKL